jgi:hypothetical protein
MNRTVKSFIDGIEKEEEEEEEEDDEEEEEDSEAEALEGCIPPLTRSCW